MSKNENSQKAIEYITEQINNSEQNLQAWEMIFIDKSPLLVFRGDKFFAVEPAKNLVYLDEDMNYSLDIDCNKNTHMRTILHNMGMALMDKARDAYLVSWLG